MDWLEFSNALDKKLSGVYCIRNIINNKRYVGISTSLHYRIKKHYHQLINNIHHNKYLQRSFNKYGIDSFVVEVLEVVPETNLLLKEHYYQALFKTTDNSFGYNDLLTDINGKLRHSIKSKEKISIAHKGKPKSPESIEKMKRALTGRKGIAHTVEHKAHISAIMKNRPKSEETRRKISSAKKGIPSPFKGIKGVSPSDSAIANMRIGQRNRFEKMKPQYEDMSGNQFKTLGEACKYHNVTRITMNKWFGRGKLRRII